MKKGLIASLRIGLAAFVMLFATNLLPVASAMVSADGIHGNNPPGNNGTLKLHELGTPAGTESNAPKVCAFNFEGSDFDGLQNGQLVIEPQGNDSVTTDSATLPFGPADSTGYAESAYINDGVQTLDNGHYKVTLYGKDNLGGYTVDLKAKSNDFKVECPAAPTATAQIVACVNESGATDKVSVSVTNTADATNASVTYSVVLGGQTKSITLADGATSNVEFGGLAVGSYTAVVTGTDGTVTTNSVTVNLCAVTPPIPGLGGGDTNGTVLGILTGAPVVTAPKAPAPQPELVNTGQNSIVDMIVGLAIAGIALTTAGLARRRQTA